MKPMQRGKGRGCNTLSLLPVGVVCALVLTALGGCSTIRTPLPDIKPTASTSLSKEERKKAVEELNKVRATHEQAAQEQIEQSR
jgi:hypothetical protein